MIGFYVQKACLIKYEVACDFWVTKNRCRFSESWARFPGYDFSTPLNPGYDFTKSYPVLGTIFAPPGATFQINVRPPLRMVSGVSAFWQIKNFQNVRNNDGTQPSWNSIMIKKCCPSIPWTFSAAKSRGPCDSGATSSGKDGRTHAIWSIFLVRSARKCENRFTAMIEVNYSWGRPQPLQGWF